MCCFVFCLCLNGTGFAQSTSNEDTSQSTVESIVPDTSDFSNAAIISEAKDSQPKLLEEEDFRRNINRLWMVIAAFLVFFMQAGFKVFEVGLVRKIDGNSVGFKNLADWLIVTVVFWGVGFALMFGSSSGGVFGTSFWVLDGINGPSKNSDHGYEYFLFQLAFAATAVTIVSGALAVRIKLVSYMILACLVAAIIYPVFWHWAWGDSFSKEGVAWLGNIGFHDFAGSTVVHSLGAWVAITGMWFITPRLGKRIGRRSTIEIVVPNTEYNKFEPHNLGYSVLGVLILWLGWWGFNGGTASFITDPSSQEFQADVFTVLLNTNLAGAVAGLAAFFHCFWFQGKKKLFEKTLGGVLGGLVAITAGCDVLSPGISIVLGALAGIFHNIAYDRLNDRTLFGKIIDDPVGAIPVHGVCGILGTLFVSFGADQLGKTFVQQLIAQFIGVVVCAVFTIVVSIVFFYFLRTMIGLEIEPKDESIGKTI